MPSTATLASLLSQSISIGRLVSVDADGQPYVVVPVILPSPTACRTMVAFLPEGRESRTSTVAVMFEDGNPELPIIVGLIHDRLQAASSGSTEGSRRPAIDARIDGRRLTLHADHEIALVCGDSSIVMTRDGKVTIKGAHLVSRSSGPNKIRGATVDIN